MKILHLGDLHIGKKVNDISMLEDQKYVLFQAIDLIEKENIKSVLICGDVFDKPIPSIEAINLFSDFLKELNKLAINVFIIAGNHDNIERLSYLSSFLEKSKIYFSKSYEGSIQKYSLEEDIDIFLMPYLYPAIVRKFHSEIELNSYNDAIKKVVDGIKTDKNKVNIILAHQFVTGRKEKIIVSDSEQKSAGAVDEISCEIFKKFDYTALGHIHCPQKAGCENVCYSGSILKYSLSEINQNKVFTILNIENKKINFEFKKINFLHDIKCYRGKFREFIDEKFYSTIKKDDYIHFILEDGGIIDAKKELSLIYPNIMLLEFDNCFTRNMNNSNLKKIENNKAIDEHFFEFFKFQTGQDACDFDKKLVQDLINSSSGGNN